MLSISAGSICSLPLPIDPAQGQQPPSAVQFLGVLKLRRPSRFDLDSISSLKRASGGEGGASSGGYLLSSLALDPHSLITLSTAPLIINNLDPDSEFIFYCPPDAFPSYKGDAFDFEYVLIRKRLIDGHLELMIVQVIANLGQPGIKYSRDCPAAVSSLKRISLNALQEQLRRGDLIDREALEILRKASAHPETFETPHTLTYSVKDDDNQEVAKVYCVRSVNTINSIDISLIRQISKLKAELYKIEEIDDLFSSGTQHSSSKLIYRKEYDGIDMLCSLSLEDLPSLMPTFTCAICSVKLSLVLQLGHYSCSLQLLNI